MKLKFYPPAGAVLLIPAAALLLAGCAAGNGYCLRKQPYTDAHSIPVLQSAGKLKISRAAGAYAVPPPVQDPVPFGRKVKKPDGKTQIVCLDQPPPIPAPRGDSISVPDMKN